MKLPSRLRRGAQIMKRLSSIRLGRDHVDAGSCEHKPNAVVDGVSGPKCCTLLSTHPHPPRSRAYPSSPRARRRSP
jgi:hypothetical protein